MAKADLSVDWTPHEFLNGDDGTNHGHPIQGWNGAVFATAYLGALGLDRVSDSEMVLKPKIDRDFETWLVVPGGTIRVRRVSGKITVAKESSRVPYRLVVE
jgi:hypothetical protein